MAATFAVAVALSAAAVLLVTTLRADLIRGIDATATQRAGDIASLVVGGTVPAAPLPAARDQAEAQVLGADGVVLASTPELVGQPALLPAGYRGPPVSTADPQEDGEVRLLAVPAGPGDALTVVIRSPLDQVGRIVSRLRTSLAVGVPVLVALLAVVIHLLVRLTLDTVERLRSQLAEVTATDLNRRVDVPPAQDGIRALALTLNDVLARLQASAGAQRRFVADAAHELRSPLAALRIQLEVGQRAGDRADWSETVPRMIADTERLARLVDDLLALALLDGAARPRPHVPVDLDEVVFDQVRDVRQTATVAVRTEAVSAGLVSGDRDLLVRVVRNLLDNAVRHAAGEVRVSLCGVDGHVELVVADDGPGIPVLDRARVFDRFERLDDARGRSGGGSGLGLAIVREGVTAHGGTVDVQDGAPGARFVVWFPPPTEQAAVRGTGGRVGPAPGPG